MAAQYELLKELLNSGTKLNFGQEFFFKFYQAFLLKDRWRSGPEQQRTDRQQPGSCDE